MATVTLISTVALGVALPAAQPGAAPELDFRAPASMAPVAERLDGLDRRRVAAVMRLVGLEAPGPPIRVVLAPEDSPLAKATPGWIAGYTRGGVIVLLPTRAPSYPNDSLEELLQHEVAHVLINRAAGGRTVPRWFHEGLALAAERAWGLADRARFVWEVGRGGKVPIERLDALFDGARGSVFLAYSVAGAFVEDLIVEQGIGWPARVLGRMSQGEPFDEAFLTETGETVPAASEDFWHRRWFVAVWLPWATSPGTMWSVITLLALAAIVRLRVRRAARRRQWEAEEGPDIPGDPPYTVH